MFLIQKMTQKRRVKGNDYEVFTVVTTLLLYRCCRGEKFKQMPPHLCILLFFFIFFLLFFLKFWRGGGMVFGCMCIELQMAPIPLCLHTLSPFYLYIRLYGLPLNSSSL